MIWMTTKACVHACVSVCEPRFLAHILFFFFYIWYADVTGNKIHLFTSETNFILSYRKTFIDTYILYPSICIWDHWFILVQINLPKILESYLEFKEHEKSSKAKTVFFLIILNIKNKPESNTNPGQNMLNSLHTHYVI